MKKVEANRYPHSATLFKFCKEALEIRYDGNVKVIDQDVGAILGYDPADCSHWKKGKKNIRALGTLRSIADHLSIDERLLIDIAAGKIGLDEAVFEYKGYGAFDLNGKNLENLKKEFFKNPGKWQTDSDIRSFEEMFDINRPEVIRVAEMVLSRGHFTEAPIYMPEIATSYTSFSVSPAESSSAKPYTCTIEGQGASLKTIIQFRGPEMRPYVRFIVAKELFKHLVRSENPVALRFKNVPDEVLDIQANIFAGVILVPGAMLRQEVEKIDSSIDIVMQLSDTFWVSKALMNQRLRDYMEHLT